ncbi:MAG: ATP-binding protein [Gemmatimonadaceae bacterium]
MMPGALGELADQVIQTVPTPLVVLDAGMRVQSANDAFEALFNRSRAPLIGRRLAELRDGQWSEALLLAVRATLDGGDAALETDGVISDDGAMGPLTMRIDARWLRSDDTHSLMLLSLIDVTAARVAEAALASERRELERSNAALAEFAHAASHDLQEPLRKIMAFSDRVIRNHGDLLPPGGRDDLARIGAAALRMRTLTDGLLAAARAATAPTTFASVDLAVVTSEVLQDLDTRIAELDARVIVGDLPSIEADAFQMRQLIQNLLANALKFHRTDVPTEVSITAEPIGSAIRLSVRDNGIGFEEQYRERIFGMFMRLHSRSEYDGSGLGLSLCRTIAARHRGSIDAASQAGLGSTFTVTLPRTQPSVAGHAS